MLDAGCGLQIKGARCSTRRGKCEMLPSRRACPGWFLVDGSGIIHPRGAGVATMLGVLAGVPTVGITKKRLFGRVDTSGMRPGMSRAVMDGRRKLGVAIRPRTGTERPLFVSPGHGVSVAAAERIVRRDFHPKSIAGCSPHSVFFMRRWFGSTASVASGFGGIARNMRGSRFRSSVPPRARAVARHLGARISQFLSHGG